MPRYIDADALIAEYDRVHVGPAGGARKLMTEAPIADAAPKSEVAREIFEDIDSKISCFFPVSSFVNAPHTTHYRLLDMLAELKKKYTKEKDETDAN